MGYIKKLLRNYWILSVFCIIVGIALIVNPYFFTRAIGYVTGGLFAAAGAAELIKYFFKAKDNSEYSCCLVRGIILAAIGIFILVKPDFIPKVIAVSCGIYMLVSGIIRIQDSINIKRGGDDAWLVSFIPAVLTALLGFVLVFNPLAPVKAAMMILGIGLLISGVTNVVGSFTVGRKLNKLDKFIKSQKKSSDDGFIDI